MPVDDHETTAYPQARTRPECAPTFRDLLAVADAARRVSTPPRAEAPRPEERPAVPDQDAA